MGKFISAAPDAIRTRNSRYPVDRIVIHAMDGTMAGTVAWFRKAGRSPPTAAHYCIGRDGSIVQMVPDDRKALHAGSTTESGWNDRSIGIEFEVRVTPWGRSKARFPVNEWPEAMLAAGATVVAVLCEKYGLPVDRAHVIGHSEVPGATHVDPGPGFEWEGFMASLRPSAPRLQ